MFSPGEPAQSLLCYKRLFVPFRYKLIEPRPAEYRERLGKRYLPQVNS